jgi:hypothetical protein
VENKGYVVKDSQGATYWVVAVTPTEASDFVVEELKRDGLSDDTKVEYVEEVDPANVPVYDEDNDKEGTMVDHLDIKGVLGCDEW